MSKPTKHYGKWRIRWSDEDEHGNRKSAVFDEYKTAVLEERKRAIEVEEVKRGQRNPAPPDKTFDDLCDYWIEKRAILSLLDDIDQGNRTRNTDKRISVVRRDRHGGAS